MPNADKVTLLNADNTPVNSTNPLPVSVSGSGGGDVEVVGNVASAVADSGNPVKTGGVYVAARSTNTTGNRVNTQVDVYGNALVALSDSFANGIVFSQSITDTKSASGNSLPGDAVLRLWNGTNFSRWYQASGATGTALVELGPYTATRVTGDAQIKGAAGFVHTVTFSPTGSVTAGTITIYNSTAESGTQIFSCALPSTTFTPFSVSLDALCGTGIYVGYDGTVANVQTTVSFR